VLKGPASVLYGSEAIGGVVNIITKKGGAKPVEAAFSGTYDSSTDGYQAFGSVSGLYKGLGYRISGTYSDQGDRESAQGVLENSAYQFDNVYAYLDYSWKTLSVGMAYNNYDSDINSYTPPEEIEFPITRFQLDLPRWSREKYSGFFEIADVSGFLAKARAEAYYQNTVKDFRQEMDLDPVSFLHLAMNINTNNDQSTTGARVQLDWQLLRRNYLVTGFDYTGDDLDADSSQIMAIGLPPIGVSFPPLTLGDHFQEAKMDTFALYLQDEWTFLEDFTLTAGFRQTWVESELSATNDPDLQTADTSDAQPVFSAGLVYSGIENLALRAHFGQGYKFPDLLKLFIGTVHSDDLLPTLPNPDLSPETSDSFEVGARYSSENLYVDAAVFLSLADDYITELLLPSGRERRYTNVNSATTYGVELATGYTIRSLYLTPYLTGAWLRQKFEYESFSTWDTGRPELSGRFGVRFERDFPQPGIFLFADLYGRAAAKATEDTSSGIVLTYPAWETANLTLSASFGKKRQYTVDFNLLNIFDKFYTVAMGNVPEAGIHAVVRARVAF
jgi:hemoglobin/transferrin/lactoferrin receptor protein